jgi:hypothetical protein
MAESRRKVRVQSWLSAQFGKRFSHGPTEPSRGRDWHFCYQFKNVLRLSFSTHRILALFTHMKNPSLFAASGNAAIDTLPGQIGRDRAIATRCDLPSRHQQVTSGSLVDLLLRWTSVSGTSPRTSSVSHYISVDKKQEENFPGKEVR